MTLVQLDTSGTDRSGIGKGNLPTHPQKRKAVYSIKRPFPIKEIGKNCYKHQYFPNESVVLTDAIINVGEKRYRNWGRRGKLIVCRL